MCRQPGVQGVRLSPFLVEARDLPGLVERLRAAVGEGLHLAISSPGAKPRNEARTWISAGEDAARQATAWRNQIDSERGDRLVYISYKRWGRAGGLQDTLREVTETDLQSEFSRAPTGEALPPKILHAIKSSGVLEQVRSEDLCNFSEVVMESGDPWGTAGKSLPLLGLAQDSALEAESAEERLRANQRIVLEATMNQRRGHNAPLAGLRKALREAGVAGRAAVDLGELSVTELSKGGRKKESQSAGPKKPKKKVSKKSKKPKGAPETEPTGGTGDSTEVRLLQEVLQGSDSERVAAMEGLGRAMHEDAQPSGAHTATDQLAQALRALSDEPETGSTSVAEALLLKGGAPLALHVRGGPRALLERPLASSSEFEKRELSIDSLGPVVESWQSARSAVAESLSGRGARERSSLSGLVRAPLIALSDPDLRDLAERLVDAGAELLLAAVESGEPNLARAALLHETVLVQSEFGGAVLLLGPLHPLWLGQALARHRQVTEYVGSLSAGDARVIARTLSRSPAAPQRFPLGQEGSAKLAPPLSGLVCYESQPALAEEATLKDVGRRLVETYLAVHPYARLGLRVRLRGQYSLPLLEGMASTLTGSSSLLSLNVESGEHLDGFQSSDAREALEGGRLTLSPLDDEEASAHISCTLGESPSPLIEDQPGLVAFAGLAAGELSTDFDVFRDGLRARTSVKGVRGVAEVEQAVATAEGRSPQGAFTVEPRGFNLSNVTDPVVPGSVAWSVALGRTLSRVHDPAVKLLVHEVLADGLQVAVLSGSVEPASRLLQVPLRRLGVASTTPQGLQTLADRLGRLSRGLLSLKRSPAIQLGALLLERALQLELSSGGSSCVVAQVDRHQLAALSEVPASLHGSVCLAVADGHPLRLVLAYAAVEPPLGLSVARGGHLQGDLADLLGGVLESLKAALGEGGVAATCACEALRWILCPAAVEADSLDRAGLLDLVKRARPGAEATVELKVFLTPEHELSARATPAQLKGCEVQFLPLNTSLLDRILYS